MATRSLKFPRVTRPSIANTRTSRSRSPGDAGMDARGPWGAERAGERKGTRPGSGHRMAIAWIRIPTANRSGPRASWTTSSIGKSPNGVSITAPPYDIGGRVAAR